MAIVVSAIALATTPAKAEDVKYKIKGVAPLIEQINKDEKDKYLILKKSAGKKSLVM